MKQTQKVPLEKFQPFIVPKFPLSMSEQLSFVISSFQQLDLSAQSTSAHRHDFYEILYLTGGQGYHVLDFEPYPLQPPMFFFVSPGQVHFWELSRPLEGYAVVFPEEFLIFPSSDLDNAHAFTFFHSVGQAPYLCLEQQDTPNLNLLLESMEREYNNPKPHQASMLRAHLHILIVHLQRIYTAAHIEQDSQNASSLVRQFKHLVSEHFVTDRSVQEYAERIGISASHLSDIIKEVTGSSPGQIIRQEVALEAKRLLTHTKLTAAEIGYRLNFEDPAYFGRFFKRETGQSPSAFRRQIQEKYQMFRD